MFLRRRAVAEGVDAFILDDPGKILEYPGVVAGPDEVLHRLLDGVGDQVGANVQVANEPAHRQPVDQGQYAVGDRGESQDQRNDESQRQTHEPVPNNE
ncbi:MAG: hypothetical protein SGJ01_17970 [Gemmatimonadota bacterium]|nr:hypothetical protein [Gemmatimonadota bacterium]